MSLNSKNKSESIKIPIDPWTRKFIGGPVTGWFIKIFGFVAWIVGVILLIYGYNSIKELSFGIWMSILYTNVYFWCVYKFSSYIPVEKNPDKITFIITQELSDKQKADEQKKETPESWQNDKS